MCLFHEAARVKGASRLAFLGYIIFASGSLSSKVIIPLLPRASQHGPLRPPALKNSFESNLNCKGFHEINRTTARAGTARGTSGIITFWEKDPEATIDSKTRKKPLCISPLCSYV